MPSQSDLERFVEPQLLTHAKALAELRGGLKLSHWMWWEIPQLRGLGRSYRAKTYGLADMDEAMRFLAHPTLGPHLLEMCIALMMHRDKSPEAILGPVDALKLQSSATLFAQVPGAPDVFKDILKSFFGGMRCSRTEALLAGANDV